MDPHPDDWSLPDEPPTGGLSDRERRVVRNAWETLRDWFERSIEELEEKSKERVDRRVSDLRSEIDRLIHDERFWERELETKLRHLEAFEVEFGSTRTAEESQHLFRAVRAQLSARDSRWERILDKLDRLSDD